MATSKEEAESGMTRKTKKCVGEKCTPTQFFYKTEVRSGFFPQQSGTLQREHQRGDQHQLQQDARDRFRERAR